MDQIILRLYVKKYATRVATLDSIEYYFDMPSVIRHPATRLDVARAAGVSLATAALALSDHPRVAPATKVRVHDAAQRLGFVANAAARRLARGHAFRRSTAIEQVALVYFQPAGVTGEQTFLALISGLEAQLAQINACLILVRITSPDDLQKIDRLVGIGSVDAFVLLGAIDEEAVKKIALARLPFVVLGAHQALRPVHSIDVDYAAVGRLAVTQLAGLGHRRIAYCAGSMLHRYQHELLRGFRDALRDLGLDDDDRLFKLGGHGDARSTQAKSRPVTLAERRQGFENLVQSQLLSSRRGPAPTAMFAAELGWGMELCRALDHFQLPVPSKISVLAVESATGNPHGFPLASVELPLIELGRQAALQLRRIVNEEHLASSDIKVAPRFVDGWSVGPVSP